MRILNSCERKKDYRKRNWLFGSISFDRLYQNGKKGLSVPDADLLVKLADILEVSVAELLGGNIPDCEDTNELAEQLSRINEQLAIKNRRSRRIWKVVLGIIVAFVVINIFFVIVGVISNNSYREYTNVEQLPISEENQTYENNP